MADTLVDVLIKLQNKSGSIPSAPHSMKKLKESIEGVPFELLTKGMSGVMDQAKIMQGIKALASQLGGLQNLGDFQSILGKVANGSASIQELTKAMGDVQAMTSSLSTYLPANLQAEIAALAPKEK